MNAPNLIIKSTDLEEEQQKEITQFASQKFETLKTKPSELATEMKKYLDENFDNPWHVIVGKSFASSLSHEQHGFIYFYVDNLAFLCFKTI